MKNRKLVSIALASMLAMGAAGPAFADDGKSAGDFMIRLRTILVQPDESADITVIGGDINISDEFTAEFDFTYFFTDNIAAELIAATTKHSVTATDTLLGDVGLDQVNLLPPTLLVQYHFLPKQQISPYAGIGVNYTFFYNEDAPGGAVTSINYDDHFGWALQLGVDYKLRDHWYLNFDVKKIFLETTASLNHGAIIADVDIDPWVVGLGVGYKF